MTPVHKVAETFVRQARAALADLDSQRAQLLRAIDAVEGITRAGTARPAPPTAPAPVIVDELHDALTSIVPEATGQARVTALLGADTRAAALRQRDQARLRELLAHGPITLRACAEALGVGREQAKYMLKKLRAAGVVVGEGETAQRVFRLAASDQVPPPPLGVMVEELVPVWSGASRQSMADVLQARRNGGRA